MEVPFFCSSLLLSSTTPAKPYLSFCTCWISLLLRTNLCPIKSVRPPAYNQDFFPLWAASSSIWISLPTSKVFYSPGCSQTQMELKMILNIQSSRLHPRSLVSQVHTTTPSLDSVGDGTQGFVHTRQALCQLSHCLGSGPRFVNPLECGQNKKSHQESSLGLDYKDSKTYTNLKIVWSPGLAKPRTVRNRKGWVRKLGCSASDNCTHFTIFTFVKCKITFYNCY